MIWAVARTREGVLPSVLLLFWSVTGVTKAKGLHMAGFTPDHASPFGTGFQAHANVPPPLPEERRSTRAKCLARHT